MRRTFIGAAVLAAVIALSVFAVRVDARTAPLAAETAGPPQTAVIRGTPGHDVIFLTASEEGTVTATVGDRRQSFAAAQTSGYLVDALAGDDLIVADPSLTAPLSVYAGGGSDRIDVRGACAAYLDGGPGDDAISGGTGPAQLFGGSGDDALALRGTTGTMAGGPGTDFYEGGTSASRIFAARGEVITSPARVTIVPESKDAAGRAPGSILRVGGSDAFRRRVAADVTALLSLGGGRRLLTALDDAGLVVRVTESAGANQTVVSDPKRAYLRAGGAHGKGSASTVRYAPDAMQFGAGSAPWQRRPPVVGLLHELIHALNAATGTMQPGLDPAGVPNLELQAIGLPLQGIAIRWTASSAPGSGNPRAFTENRLRDLLGLQQRAAY